MLSILQGDCLNLPLQPKSVDLVFTSPPYEDARQYGLGFKLKGQDWVDWAVPRFVECLRVCRGLVAWVVAGRTRQFSWSGTPSLLEADLLRTGVHLRNPPAFHRVGIPGSGGPDWLRADHERIVCASQGRLPWSDNTACGHPPKYGKGGPLSHRTASGDRVNTWRMAGGRSSTGEQLPNVRRPLPEKVNPGNVISGVVGGGHLGSKLGHENEAPFPEWLVEFFVKSFCPPGGVALDPFGGSGTVAAVCKRLGRSAVSLDIRASQCDLTRRRLEEISDG